MLSLIFSLIMPMISDAKQIKIAVIDTGYTQNTIFNATLCKGGHADFTQSGLFVNGVPLDTHGHGSIVS